MTPFHTAKHRQGWSIEVFSSHNGHPPDYHGMSPATTSIWLRFQGYGPNGWWRMLAKGPGNAKNALELRMSDDYTGPTDIIKLCDLWNAETGAT